MLPYMISSAPTIPLSILIMIIGISVLNKDTMLTTVPIKRNVANPAAHPNIRSSLLEYLFSIALVVNRLVHMMIVSGLVMVSAKVDKKLLSILDILLVFSILPLV